MKTLFIPAKYTGNVNLSEIETDKLPKKIGLVTTAQFLGKIKDVADYLKTHGKEVFIGKIKQKNGGQISKGGGSRTIRYPPPSGPSLGRVTLGILSKGQEGT